MNGTLSGLLACVLWSSSALLVALTTRIPPFEIMAVSWGAGLLFLATVFVRPQTLAAMFCRPLKDYIFVLGSIAGYTILYYFAFQLAPPFEANTLNYLWPIFFVIFSSFNDKKPLEIKALTGVFLGFSGCVLLLLGKGGFHLGGLGWGHFLALGCAIIWAAYSSLAHYKDYPSSFIFPVFIISTFIYIAAHQATEQWVQPTTHEWVIMVALGIVDIAFVLWDHGVRRGNRKFLISVSYFVPFFSTLFLIIGGFAPSNPYMLAAAGLVIVGCLIVHYDEIIKSFIQIWTR